MKWENRKSSWRAVGRIKFKYVNAQPWKPLAGPCSAEQALPEGRFPSRHSVPFLMKKGPRPSTQALGNPFFSTYSRRGSERELGAHIFHYKTECLSGWGSGDTEMPWGVGCLVPRRPVSPMFLLFFGGGADMRPGQRDTVMAASSWDAVQKK